MIPALSSSVVLWRTVEDFKTPIILPLELAACLNSARPHRKLLKGQEKKVPNCCRSMRVNLFSRISSMEENTKSFAETNHVHYSVCLWKKNWEMKRTCIHSLLKQFCVLNVKLSPVPICLLPLCSGIKPSLHTGLVSRRGHLYIYLFLITIVFISRLSTFQSNSSPSTRLWMCVYFSG